MRTPARPEAPLIHVVYADGHAGYRDGLGAAITDCRGLVLAAACADGLSALQRITELRPELALLDYRLPILDGLEICREVGGRQNDTAVVLLAAILSSQLEAAAGAAGAVSVLAKDMPRSVICRDLLRAGAAASSR